VAAPGGAARPVETIHRRSDEATRRKRRRHTMAKVLNQNELDALLNMVQAEGAEPTEAAFGDTQKRRTSAREGWDNRAGYNVANAENVYIFDFKRPERVSQEQASALEVLHENFARNISASLSGYLRTVIEVRLISVEQFTYSEFTMSVPSPTIFNSLSCAPLSGNMILEMNPSIIFPFIDRLLGGGSETQVTIERPFTQIERGLINTIISRILDQLKEAWLAIQPIDFRVVDTETNPMLMQIVAPNEPVILLSFEVVMGTQSGLVNLCVPFRVIKPIIEEFTQTNWFSVVDQGPASEARDRLLENVRKAEIETTAFLADVSIRLTDLLGLQVGDIIELGKGPGSEAVLQVGTEMSFFGTPASHRGQNAIVLTRPVDPRKALV
jgi:flagellar motor switch protein FliM